MRRSGTWGERQLLRLGEYLVGVACRRLPRDVRAERHREWSAELPAILHDREIRFAPWRAVRMLGYAADTWRGSARTAGRGRAAALGWLLLVALVPSAGYVIWAIVRAPGDGPNYLGLAWALLALAFCINVLAHRNGRVRTVLWISLSLVLAAQYLWRAAQAPRDWSDYLLTGVVLLALGCGVRPMISRQTRR